ncbi:MAG: hypothetical protein ACE5HE_01575 [Phycisphaerae bacterium]
MMKPRRPGLTGHRGVVLAEACVSIMLVGLVLGMVSLMLTRYARSLDYFVNYRRAQLAAESCVERMRAGAIPAADATLTDEVGLTYEIRVANEEGSWQPLKRVDVTASVPGKYSRIARYRICTYIAPQSITHGADP